MGVGDARPNWIPVVTGMTSYFLLPLIPALSPRAEKGSHRWAVPTYNMTTLGNAKCPPAPIPGFRSRLCFPP